MILLTKLNDQLFLLNPDQIESVIFTPDTTIKLLNGNLYIVKETLEELVFKVKEYKKEILSDSIINN